MTTTTATTADWHGLGVALGAAFATAWHVEDSDDSPTPETAQATETGLRALREIAELLAAPGARVEDLLPRVQDLAECHARQHVLLAMINEIHPYTKNWPDLVEVLDLAADATAEAVLPAILNLRDDRDLSNRVLRLLREQAGSAGGRVMAAEAARDAAMEGVDELRRQVAQALGTPVEEMGQISDALAETVGHATHWRGLAHYVAAAARAEAGLLDGPDQHWFDVACGHADDLNPTVSSMEEEFVPTPSWVAAWTKTMSARTDAIEAPEPVERRSEYPANGETTRDGSRVEQGVEESDGVRVP